MPGLEKDHEFLYLRGVSNDFPRYSLVWGSKSPAHPIHDLYPWPDPTSSGKFGEILWDNSSNASNINEVILFFKFSLGCPAVPIWERSMRIKKIGKTFSENFFGVIYSSHLTVQCLFRLFIYQMRFLSCDFKVHCNFPKFQVFHFHFHWEDTFIFRFQDGCKYSLATILKNIYLG